MKAISSEECLIEMGTNGMDCNTCSTQFQGFPAYYPGNMWVADCDYIDDLIPPVDFEPRKKQITELMVEATHKVVPGNKIDNRWIMSFDDGTTLRFHNASRWQTERPSWIGMGHYAMEHWLGSHPGLKPCDVFSPKDGVPTFGYDDLDEKNVYANKLTPKLETAPGLTFKEQWDQKYGLHPWYRRGGRRYEYNYLYGGQPDKSSWFLKYWNGTIGLP